MLTGLKREGRGNGTLIGICRLIIFLFFKSEKETRSFSGVLEFFILHFEYWARGLLGYTPPPKWRKFKKNFSREMIRKVNFLCLQPPKFKSPEIDLLATPLLSCRIQFRIYCYINSPVSLDLIFHFSRDPRSIVEHENELAGMTPQQLKDLIANNTPKATRNIFLIRHGQYKKEKAKEEKKLTPLGI